jgi:hypothetical protein
MTKINWQEQKVLLNPDTWFSSELFKDAGPTKNMIKKCLCICFVFILVTVSLKAQQSLMTPLFDGKSLNGWKVRSGFATYKVVEGTIVGTTAEGSGNSFLCTLKEYGDFVLEFEVKFDPELNSGVQFRSHAYEKETEVSDADGNKHKFPADRVYGYQFEIATSRSGGVYDEARRAIFIGGPDKASAQIKTNDWNKCRIIAQGDHILTFVNGVAIADFHDKADYKGFIGLQVHQINKGQGPFSVRWRNINIQVLKPGEKIKDLALLPGNYRDRTKA